MTPRSAREGWCDEQVGILGALIRERILHTSELEKVIKRYLRDAMAFADAHPMAEGEGAMGEVIVDELALCLRCGAINNFTDGEENECEAVDGSMGGAPCGGKLARLYYHATPPAQGARVLCEEVIKVDEFDGLNIFCVGETASITFSNRDDVDLNEGDTVRVRVTEEPS